MNCQPVDNKRKVAFVIQRYGLEVNGGAEVLCRKVAEKLSKYWDIEVITTCALDHNTWKNFYPKGVENINNVKVNRFKVDHPRNLRKMSKYEKCLNSTSHSIKSEENWIYAQGPVSKSLLNYLKTIKDKFDFFIFFTYLYYPTIFGLQEVGNNSFLVPTIHDEKPVYLDIVKKILQIPKLLICSTVEEEQFIKKQFGDHIKTKIIALGIDNCNGNLNGQSEFARRIEKNPQYILYIGRIENGKGTDHLINFFLDYKEKFKSSLTLIIAGKKNDRFYIPNNDNIEYLGFVSEKEKLFLIQNANIIVNSSQFESLSMIILESWLNKKPVLVNGKSEVMVGQCRRSQGGLWYNNKYEFFEALEFLTMNKTISAKMAANGYEYVLKNYSWEVVERKYLSIFNHV